MYEFAKPNILPPDNQPEVTEAIKPILKDDYNYDSTVRLITRFPFTSGHLTDYHMGIRTPFMLSIAPSTGACSLKTAAEFCFTRIEGERPREWSNQTSRCSWPHGSY